MNRKILIITNPGEKGDEHYCSGVYVDSDNYNDFFKSPMGGYWSDSEILILDKPTKLRVEQELNTLANMDFSIIIFCGHGFYSSHSESNILELKKSERIDSLDLRKNSNKRIIILDSCREVHPEYLTDSIQKAKMFSASFETLTKLNPQDCKRYYNETINECSKQTIIAYAADINELAGDSSSKGGYYTSSLLKESRKWVDNNISSVDLTSKYRTCSFPASHDLSIPSVQKLSGGEQNPQIEKPRIPSGTKFLPFIIIA